VLLPAWNVYSDVFERFTRRVGGPTNVSVLGFFLFGFAYGAASLSRAYQCFRVDWRR
jgi:hypothetical protein